MQINGECHCGNLRFEFQTDLGLEQLSIRSCDCSFCQRHGAKCTSDPNGLVKIFVKDLENLNRYQFDAKTADFLVCKTCGVYIGATIASNGIQRATVNLMATSLRNRESTSTSYQNETKQQRIDRRFKKWTPAIFVS